MDYEAIRRRQEELFPKPKKEEEKESTDSVPGNILYISCEALMVRCLSFGKNNSCTESLYVEWNSGSNSYEELGRAIKCTLNRYWDESGYCSSCRRKR